MKFVKDLFASVFSNSSSTSQSESDTLHKIASELDSLDEGRARKIATFAYVLSRVATSDHTISDVESQAMEKLVSQFGGLTAGQAAMVVQMAKAGQKLFGGTDNFLATQEFGRGATHAEKLNMLELLFAVSAADGVVKMDEEREIRLIAGELGLSHHEFIDARLKHKDKREVNQ